MKIRQLTLLLTLATHLARAESHEFTTKVTGIDCLQTDPRCSISIEPRLPNTACEDNHAIVWAINDPGGQAMLSIARDVMIHNFALQVTYTGACSYQALHGRKYPLALGFGIRKALKQSRPAPQPSAQ